MKRSLRRRGSKSSSRGRSKATPVSHDWIDLLNEFNAAEIRYLIIGGHAVMFYTEPKYTKDIDIWVDTRQHVEVYQCFRRFGAPLVDISQEEFARPDMIYQLGVAPLRIDVLTSVADLSLIRHGRTERRAAMAAFQCGSSEYET